MSAAVMLTGYAGAGVASLPADLAALEQAADKGDPQAQTVLAGRYENAEGVPRDYEKANRLYCRAARSGYPEAQFKLGWAYANGRGMPHDDGVAAALFTMAAAQGHEYAARLLGYVRAKADTPLPACLQPDPPTVAARNQQGADEAADAGDADAAAIARVPPAIRQLVDSLAPQYAVDSRLALAVIAAESAFNPNAVSPKNAQGLMQLIPETAARFGVKRIFNPAENIRGGLAYLRWLLAFFRGDVTLVLAAYNAGEGAVEKYRGVPPYPETRSYVERITRVYRRARHPYEANVVEPSRIVAARTTVRDVWDARPIARTE